jgi:hypothetical protein
VPPADAAMTMANAPTVRRRKWKAASSLRNGLLMA